MGRVEAEGDRLIQNAVFVLPPDLLAALEKNRQTHHQLLAL
jgi:hypothetical protein